jgi:hypothetical protein
MRRPFSLARDCEPVHNADLAKNAALTVRLPASLKARLAARAEAEHRLLSAQVLAELEGLVEKALDKPRSQGRFLGLYAGTTVPSDADLVEVRARLWGGLVRGDGG